MTFLLIVTVWNLVSDVPDSWWLAFWHVWIWIFTAGAAGVTLWFTIGGFSTHPHSVRPPMMHSTPWSIRAPPEPPSSSRCSE